MKSIAKIILFCVMVIYVIFGASAVISAVAGTDNLQMTEVSDKADSSTDNMKEQTGFIVKSVSGKIAVEEIATGKIIKTTDTRVAILPEKDQKQLEKGITVKNKSELRSVLEDYCS